MLLAFIEREEHINSHNQLNHTGKDRLSPQNSGHFLDYFKLIISEFSVIYSTFTSS